MDESFIQHAHDRGCVIEIPHFAGARRKLDGYCRNELPQKIDQISITLFMPSRSNEFHQGLELLIRSHEIVKRMPRNKIFKTGIGD